VGLFNRGERTVEVAATWADLGVSGEQTVRDLWRQKDAGVFAGRYAAPVGRPGGVLVKLSTVR
jgi:alpha-galactosidase